MLLELNFIYKESLHSDKTGSNLRPKVLSSRKPFMTNENYLVCSCLTFLLYYLHLTNFNFALCLCWFSITGTVTLLEVSITRNFAGVKEKDLLKAKFSNIKVTIWKLSERNLLPSFNQNTIGDSIVDTKLCFWIVHAYCVFLKPFLPQTKTVH